MAEGINGDKPSESPPPAYSESTKFITAKFSEKAIRFSVNLLDASRNSIDFLRLVNKSPDLYDAPLINYAIYRYETLWLPLAAKYGSSGSAKWVAPLDIQWAWHVHMLAPLYYEKDCKQIVGGVVDHELTPLKDYPKAMSSAKKAWEQAYPQEPFEIDVKKVGSNGKTAKPPDSYVSKITYDIATASSRQRTFFYQCSLPHYLDKVFLEKAIERYKKYCFLKSHNKNTFLVPCYDFDVVWHAHQAHPYKYKEDTERIIGKMLNHDDSVNERHEGSKLMQADALTREMWTQVFNESFNINGAMFRGDLPSGIGTMSKEQLLKVGFSQTPFRITQLKLTMGNDVLETKKLKIMVKYSNKKMTVNLSPGQTSWSDQLPATSGNNQFILDTSLIHKLNVVSLKISVFSVVN